MPGIYSGGLQRQYPRGTDSGAHRSSHALRESHRRSQRSGVGCKEVAAVFNRCNERVPWLESISREWAKAKAKATACSSRTTNTAGDFPHTRSQKIHMLIAIVWCTSTADQCRSARPGRALASGRWGLHSVNFRTACQRPSCEEDAHIVPERNSSRSRHSDVPDTSQTHQSGSYTPRMTGRDSRNIRLNKKSLLRMLRSDSSCCSDRTVT